MLLRLVLLLVPVEPSPVLEAPAVAKVLSRLLLLLLLSSFELPRLLLVLVMLMPEVASCPPAAPAGTSVRVPHHFQGFTFFRNTVMSSPVPKPYFSPAANYTWGKGERERCSADKGRRKHGLWFKIRNSADNVLNGLKYE